MLEVIVHGRGGQGAVTLSRLIAIASFYEGKYSQAFPMFGIERRGAPASAFVRIDEKPILLRQQIYEADAIIVLDTTLLQILNIKGTLKKKGKLYVNSHKSPDEIKKDYSLQGVDICTFDATTLALQVFKKNIVNSVMFAVFAAMTKLVHLNAAYRAIEERFESSKESIILNKKIVGEVYNKILK
jgi:2-oxoacid:acceptor oxidoreductase gamma subunit (pyruvate/2-ketoisovalerate family)